jgi:hypothetical protein
LSDYLKYQETLGGYCLIWLIIIGFMFFDAWKKKSKGVGLSLGFVMTLTVGYWFGGFIHSLPWYESSSRYILQREVDVEYLSRALFVCLSGLVAFVFGNVVLFRLFSKRVKSVDNPHPKETSSENAKLPQKYILIAIFFNLLLGPFLAHIPSLGSVANAGWIVLPTGICLLVWKRSILRHHRMQFIILVGGSIALLPAFTMITTGFLGFGVRSVIVIVVFGFVFYKPRWHLVVLCLIGVYIGLSFFVAYMGQKDELRQAAWYEQSSSAAATQVGEMFKNFAWLDLRNPDHLAPIDIRLCETLFMISRGIERLDMGYVEYGKGENLYGSLVALVPRILWPNKPLISGGSEFVTKYTGIKFTKNTSIASGPVFELYVNGGVVIVIIGFMTLGAFLAFLDIRAAHYLTSGDWRKFMVFFSTGAPFLNNESGFAMIVGSSFTALLISLGINWCIPNKKSKKGLQQI